MQEKNYFYKSDNVFPSKVLREVKDTTANYMAADSSKFGRDFKYYPINSLPQSKFNFGNFTSGLTLGGKGPEISTEFKFRSSIQTDLKITPLSMPTFDSHFQESLVLKKSIHHFDKSHTNFFDIKTLNDSINTSHISKDVAQPILPSLAVKYTCDVSSRKVERNNYLYNLFPENRSRDKEKLTLQSDFVNVPNTFDNFSFPSNSAEVTGSSVIVQINDVRITLHLDDIPRTIGMFWLAQQDAALNIRQSHYYYKKIFDKNHRRVGDTHPDSEIKRQYGKAKDRLPLSPMFKKSTTPITEIPGIDNLLEKMIKPLPIANLLSMANVSLHALDRYEQSGLVFPTLLSGVSEMSGALFSFKLMSNGIQNLKLGSHPILNISQLVMGTTLQLFSSRIGDAVHDFSTQTNFNFKESITSFDSKMLAANGALLIGATCSTTVAEILALGSIFYLSREMASIVERVVDKMKLDSAEFKFAPTMHGLPYNDLLATYQTFGITLRKLGEVADNIDTFIEKASNKVNNLFAYKSNMTVSTENSKQKDLSSGEKKSSRYTAKFFKSTSQHSNDLVKLKNGSKIPKETYISSIIKINELCKNNAIACYELLEKCKDPNHVMFGNTQEIIEKLNLMSLGRAHDDVCDVILSITEDKDLEMTVLSP